jgi:hypothetical protein
MAQIRDNIVQWADIVIRIWEEKMLQLQVHDTFELANSFIHHIIGQAGGDITRIEFAYNYYGKFADMGVGKGVSLMEQRQGQSTRQAKPWYSKTFLREVRKLAIIIGNRYSHMGAIVIKENVLDPSAKTIRL